MIGAMIAGLGRSFADVVLAGWHIVTRQARNSYATTIDIAAPPDRVWDLLTRTDTTYVAANGMRSVQVPIEGRDNAFVATMTVGERQLGRIAIEHIELVPPSRLVVRYLREHSDRPDQLGAEDRCTMTLSDGANGGTRLAIARELTHLLAATRISAPMGVRMAAHLTKTQAEHEAGVKIAATGGWLQQVAWSVAALASFWLMFGWRDALVIATVVAVHEIGHALAMLRYGLGVRVISFIPFFGGVAAPRRYYQSQWQRGIVALMGVGFSLPPTVALLAVGFHVRSEDAAHWAAISAFVNGFNLLPCPGLDGSIAVQLLLGRAPALVGRAVAGLFFAALVGLAVLANDVMIWIVVAFSLLVMVQTMSLKLDQNLPPLTRRGTAALLVLFCLLLAAYVWLGIEAVRLENDL